MECLVSRAKSKPRLPPNVPALAEALRELATKDATAIATKMGKRLRLVNTIDDEIILNKNDIQPETQPKPENQLKGGHLFPHNNPELTIKLIGEHIR